MYKDVASNDYMSIPYVRWPSRGVVDPMMSS